MQLMDSSWPPRSVAQPCSRTAASSLRNAPAVRDRTGRVHGVVELLGDRTPFRLGQVGEQQLGDGGDGDRDGLADPGVHPDRVAALDLVDVQDLVLLVHREMDGVPALFVELDEVGVGDLAYVEVLDGLLRQGEQAGSEAVALILLAVDESVLVERTEQAQRGGLVDAEAVGDLAEIGGALGEERKDAQRAVDGLTHGVGTSSDARSAAVQPGPRRSVSQAVSSRATSRSAWARAGGSVRSPGTVRTAAAIRCPCRTRSRTGRSRRVAERNPAAKASPAPTGATTSTRRAGTVVTLSGPCGDGGAGSGAGPRKDRRPLGPPLHDQHPGLRQRRTDRLRAVQPPRLLRLVLTDEDEVGAAGQVEEHGRCRVAVAPQPRPVVHVEGDQRASGAGRRQRVEQGQAVRGQRRRDPGQVQDAAAERVLGRDVRRGHRRCRGPGPVVRDLVRVGRPVGRRAEVDACGAVRVALDRRCVDAVPGDRLDQMVAEPVRTDAADPLRPVPRRRERTGDIGLGAPDRTAEGRHVGEASGLRGQERHHGLAEADDIARRGGVGRPRCGSGHSGLLDDQRSAPVFTIDPASARMLDSVKRYAQ